MEFIQLVAPQGPLWKAWIAAHWERRLKRHDYQTANIGAAAELLGRNLGSISLGCLGYLLVGLCKLLRQQVRVLDEDAREVLARLRLSLEQGGRLPSVATVSEASLSLHWPQRHQAHVWERHGDILPVGNLDDLLPLELLPPPQVPRPARSDEVAASLAEGRQHVAPLDTITLNDPAFEELPDIGEQEDEFPAPSPEDREAMEAMSQAGSSPDQRSLRSDDMPDVDRLLSDTGSGGARLPFPHSSLASMEPSEPIDSFGLIRPGLPGSSSMFGRASEDGAPTLGRPSGPGLATPTRQPTARTLQFDSASPGPGRDAPGSILSPLRGGPLSSHLSHRLFDSSPGLEGLAGDAAADLINPTGLPTQLSPAAGASAGDSLRARLLPELPGELGSGVAADARDAAPVVSAGPPAKRRRRRLKQWYDGDRTELTDEQYLTAPITRDPRQQFGVFLPHSTPYGFTTTLSDIGPALGVFFELARQVGAKRRRLRAALEASREAAPAANALGVERPTSPRLSPGGSVEGSPGLPSARISSREVTPPEPPPPGSAGASTSDVGALDGTVEKMATSPRSGVAGSPLAPWQPPSSSPALAGPAASSQRRPRSGSIDDRDGGIDGQEEQQSHSEPRSTTGAQRPTSPPIGWPWPPEAPGDEPETRVKLDAIDDASQENSSSAAVVQAQTRQVQEMLGSSTQAISFFGLCQQPPVTAEAAAFRFVELLKLHGNDVVALNQVDSYGDIEITRGRRFDEEGSPAPTVPASPASDAPTVEVSPTPPRSPSPLAPGLGTTI